MAPACAGGRMGGCETHSADLRTHPASPTHPRPRQPTTSRLFPAPIIGHRLPASSSSVLARALEGATAAGASLTRGRAAARNTGSCEEKPTESRTCEPGHYSRVTGPAHHAS